MKQRRDLVPDDRAETFLGPAPAVPEPLAQEQAAIVFERALAGAEKCMGRREPGRGRAWAAASWLAAAGAVVALALILARGTTKPGGKVEVVRRNHPPAPAPVQVAEGTRKAGWPSIERKPPPARAGGKRPRASTMRAEGGTRACDVPTSAEVGFTVQVVTRPAQTVGYARAAGWCEDERGRRRRTTWTVIGSAIRQNSTQATTTPDGPMLSVAVRAVPAANSAPEGDTL